MKQLVLRFLLTLLAVLSGTTISAAAVQEARWGIVFEKAYVCEAKPYVSDECIAPKKTGRVLCFAAGIEVATSEGSIPIEEIKEDDLVLAFDFEIREVFEREVYESHHSSTKGWVLVTTDKGDEILATRFHRFWIKCASEWIEAIELERGMVLQLASGENATIISVKAKLLDRQEKAYNFEVRDLHNYFVGESRALGLKLANQGSEAAERSAEAITLGQMNKARRIPGVDAVHLTLPPNTGMFDNPGVKPHAHGVDHKGKPWSVNIDGTPHNINTKKGSIPKKVRETLRAAGWDC